MSAPTYEEALAQAPSSGNAVTGLQSDINQLAPLAKVYASAPTPAPLATYQSPSGSQPDQGAVMNFAHFLGGVGQQIGNIAGTVGNWAKDQAVSMVTAPIRYGASLAHGIQDNYDLQSTNMVRQQLQNIQDNVTGQYKAGQISKDEYLRQLHSLSQDWDNLDRQSRSLTNRFANDYEQAKQATIDTSADLITVLTGGFGKASTTGVTGAGLVSMQARTAGDWLASAAAKPFFSGTIDSIRTIASQPEVFNALSAGTKQALQGAVADVIATGTKMSTQQIAKAAAVNLAFKYPINYWFTQSTASQLYHELDQAQYGDAVRTAAFNAALLLSGGPIGYALNFGGKAVKSLVEHTFLRSSFIDELSKGIGGGQADGLWNEITNLQHPEKFKFLEDGKLISLPKEEAQKRIAANLSALEATNMEAAGKDPVAAAWRVLKGMASYEGVSMKDFSHEDALVNMSNFAEAQRAADEAGKTLGTRLTVGRVDARDLDQISAGLTAGDKTIQGLPTEAGATQGAVDMSQAPDFLKPSTDIPPAGLPKGYTMAENGSVFGPDGKELTLGQVQELHQASYLTEFEHARNAGDQATMNRIIAEHPLDQRLDLSPSAPKTMGTDAKSQLLAKFRQQAANQTAELSPIEQRLQAWEQLKASNPNKAWAHNDNFDTQIKSLIKKYDDASQLDTAIKRIKAQFRVDGLPSELSSTLAQMGYLPIKPVNLEAPFTEGTGKIGSSFAKANSDIFTRAVQPVPVLPWVGGVLDRFGLSPYATTERVYQLFNNNLSRNLQTSGILKEVVGEDASQSADTLIKQLSSYMHNPTEGKIIAKMPITDLRMLTTKDIVAATGVTKSEAKLIQQAIARSFIQVPLAVRGMGDRMVDLAYGTGPVAFASRRYMRLQGALRFSWNPFFQYLRLIPKTEMLSEFEGGGFVRSVFAGRLGVMNDIRAGLREGGFLEKSGVIGAAATSGEAADFAGSMGRNLTHKLLPAQEASMAGLIDAQAQRMGMEWQTYLKTYPDQVRDTIQMIAQYDKHSQLLNSPLMRTLNIAFFPLRFDTKVAMIMTRSLARQPLMTQVAVIKGVMDFHQWINSDQGRAWYSKNADAIGLFNYITPMAHIAEVIQSLVPGQDHSLGNFGELGGLPFGFITQLLDSEGITHFNQAGVNPKTGELYSQYLPATTKGQIAIVIQDFLSSLFSYPGATAGLPSKTKITRNIATGIVGAKNSDFNIVQPPSTPEQLSYQQSLARMGVVSQPAQQAATTPSTSLNVPALATPTPQIRIPRGSTGTRKKKKSEFTPELLPGQTTLGQL